jgi:hypothetical protein
MGSNTTANGAAMGFAVSGATTVAASVNQILYSQSPVGGSSAIEASACCPISGLNPGSNTFTAKYEAVVGGTASFINRIITVFPLP